MPAIQQLFNLTGKVALVTGASRGLGLEIALGLGEAGASVAITARREPWLSEARQTLEDAGITCLVESCDVTDPVAVSDLVTKVLDRFGALDIVVNNAGISWGAPALTMTVERFRQVVDTNATGTFLVSQAAARHMQVRGQGVIINTSSVAGLVGTDPTVMSAVGYNASKGAIIALTRQLAIEWAPLGIRVNAIAPGFFPTRMTEGLIAHAEDRMAAAVPMGRLGREGEIKGVVVFLASDASAYMTGQVLAVDGGLTAW
jgi:NAD(P)-dependent dehydrogenase (short-subunit alcohol dehydrogenase family)